RLGSQADIRSRDRADLTERLRDSLSSVQTKPRLRVQSEELLDIIRKLRRTQSQLAGVEQVHFPELSPIDEVQSVNHVPEIENDEMPFRVIGERRGVGHHRGRVR